MLAKKASIWQKVKK